MENLNKFKPSAWDLYLACSGEDAVVPFAISDFIEEVAIAERNDIVADFRGPASVETIHAISCIFGSQQVRVAPDGTAVVAGVGGYAPETDVLQVGAGGMWYGESELGGAGRTLESLAKASMGLASYDAAEAFLAALPRLQTTEHEPEIDDLLAAARAAYREAHYG